MKKRTLTVFVVLASIASVNAQEVVSTQGDSYSSATAQIDFTIGEVVIDTGTDGTNVLTQGFQQTNWSFLSLEDLFPDFSATVYPNPVEDALIVKASSFDGVQYQMIDATGRIVLEGALEAEQTALAVSTFAPGNYTINVLRNAQTLKSFKLIKH